MYMKRICIACVVVVGGVFGAVSAGEVLDLKVDIGALDARDPNNVITQAVKAGWTEWTESRADPGPASAQKSFGDVTVTLAQSGGDGLAFRNGSGGDLTADLVCIDNHNIFPVMTMTISGLAPGNYVMTTWHNYIFDVAAVLDIKVDGELKVSDLAATIGAGDDELAASATCQFAASGDDVVVEFISKNAANVPLNGFHLQRSTLSVGFEKASSGGVETLSPAGVVVNLSEAQQQTVTVDYAVVGGSATRGSDYNLADGTVVFNPGQTTRSIDIDVISDGAAETDETIILELSNPNPGMDIEIGQHIYSIIERKPEVGFAAESSSGLETQARGIIAVELSHACDKAITVSYAVTGGTAAGGGVDYSLAGGTLRFEPGVTGRSIEFDILDDTLKESNETIIVTLSNPVNGTLGTMQQHTFSIIDDEMGVLFDGLTWYLSDYLFRLGLNESGELQWDLDKSDQLIVRLPEQRFSEVGDVATFSYVWSSSGRVEPGCECYEDRDPNPDTYEFCSDVTCVGGTGDFRLGLFDSNGRGYITAMGMSKNSEIFRGYLGYHFRFFPHVPQDAPARFSEPKDDGGSESHTNTSIWERSNPEGNSSLLSNSNSWNRIEDPMRGGLGIPPGGSALLTVRLERVSEDEAKLSLSCNGKTWTEYSATADVMPNKIDVFAIYVNSKEYDYVTFGIPESPRSSTPRPADGSQGIATNTALGWRVGSSAVSNDVYFGTSSESVGNATPASSQYQGNLTAESYNSFTPQRLDLDTSYYWRIDDVTAGGALKGDVWSFMTIECEAVEGFESYADVASLQAAWKGGGGTWLELSTEQHRQGAKSMLLQYYNRQGEKYSEVVRTFSEPQNWTGYEAFGFYYKGEAGNKSEKLYAVIEDAKGNSSIVLSPQKLNLADEQWRLWKAGLSEFVGADVAGVKKITIGAGDPDGSSSDAFGSVWIDDVGMCGGGPVAGCACPGDVNADDQIDLEDLQAVAGILLQAGSPFIVPVQDGHCADLNSGAPGAAQVDLEDLQAVAGILLNAGSPFIVPCE